MPENKDTIAAIAKANGKLARAKVNSEDATKAREELKAAIAEYDRK